ncbi:hypothetical protein [Fodinicola acaciae]|uniref:hypothetical protein n=1 Tax=Fodinicola acaciae TaxID=2681555 RepID=UPI0013D58F47|nr:hypothetical protein [Fodinicola acaciae]
MLTGEEYLQAVAMRVARVNAQGYQAQVGPMNAFVANMYDGAGAVMGQVHFCLVAASFPEVNAFIVGDFSQHAAQHAHQATNGVRGLGTAVITLVGLVSPVVRPDAVAAATAKPKNVWGGEIRPVVVDLSSGQVHMFTGTKFYGMALQGMIKGRAQASFPPPPQAEQDLRQFGAPGGPPAGQPAGPQPGPAAGPPPGPYAGPPPGPHAGPPAGMPPQPPYPPAGPQSGPPAGPPAGPPPGAPPQPYVPPPAGPPQHYAPPQPPSGPYPPR